MMRFLFIFGLSLVIATITAWVFVGIASVLIDYMSIEVFTQLQHISFFSLPLGLALIIVAPTVQSRIKWGPDPDNDIFIEDNLNWGICNGVSLPVVDAVDGARDSPYPCIVRGMSMLGEGGKMVLEVTYRLHDPDLFAPRK